MIDLGTVRPGSTIRIPFSSFDKDDGSSITMTNYSSSDILVYKDGSTTERASTSGYTATTDFDAKTGKHLAIIDLSDNTTAGFWNAGSEYLVAIDAVTIDTVTTGGWVARFRIGYPNAVLDTTIATLSSQTSFTLTNGPAEDNALKDMWAIIHDIASSVQLAKVLISAYTGSTKTVTLAAGATFTVAAGDNISVMDLAPIQAATVGRTLVVDASGLADANMVKGGPTGSGVAVAANTITNLNTIYNTDYASIYDTTNKAFTAKLGNFAMGGSSLALTTGAISCTTVTASGAVAFQSSFAITGQVTVADGIAVTCSTTNRSAFTLAGNGTGVGFRSTGGATGRGVEYIGGATSGDAFYCSTTAGHGFHVIAAGADKYGIYSHCGITGNAMVLECNPNGSAATLVDRGHAFAAFSSDTTNGNAILLRSLFHGCGVFAKASDNEAAFHLQGGLTGPAMRLWAGINGNGIPGLEIFGPPNGPAITAIGGYTGNGGTASSPTQAVRILNQSTLSGSVGVSLEAAMGAALSINAYGPGSKAVDIYSLYGHGVNIDTNGASSHGVVISGGNSGTSDGVRVNAGTGGVGMRLGSLTVTGTSTLTGAVSTSTVTMAGLAVTNALTVGSNVTITGTLSAGTNSLPWNAAWDAEVQSEAQDAITASGLMDAAATRTALGLASANLDTQLGTIDDLLDTEIAAIKAVTDQLVAAQSELSSVPAANATPLQKIAWLAMLARNKITETATTQTIYADNGSTIVATSTVSDDGSLFTRGELA